MTRLEELFDALHHNPSEIKSHDDVICENAFDKRELSIGDIDYEVGTAIEMMIRFFNQCDDEANIPPEQRKPITLYIDSNGGDLDATFTMIDAIKMSRTPVYTVCTGAALSGGFFTFICGHKRFAYQHSSFMCHEGSTGYSGDANKYKNFSKYYDIQLDELKSIVLENTKISDEEYEEHKRDDWWLTAQQAYELGVVDEIATKFIY